MKYCILAGIFFAGCLSVQAEYSEKEIKRLSRDVEIAGVRDETYRNDDREKFETLEINTFQNQDESEGFRMRIVAEVTDKKKNAYLIEYTANQPDGLDSEYTGEAYWTLSAAYGEMDKLTYTGYAIQYGLVDDEENFIPLAEEFDDVKTFDELTARTTNMFAGKVRLTHSIMYEDDEEGEIQTTARAVKAIHVRAK